MKSPRVDLAWAYIELLLTENSRLHQTIGKVDRLCGDILADCSREVYEANMVSLTDDLEDLAKFLEVHQEKIKLLAGALNQ
ncbi:MAG: hypothetical protein EBR82_85880 [Caulobacteraceae bacterium]|nr:hypothetical protein [Caulobacteraceae bacterium]